MALFRLLQSLLANSRDKDERQLDHIRELIAPQKLHRFTGLWSNMMAGGTDHFRDALCYPEPDSRP